MLEAKKISLIKKYDVQGPRYTSYPTVPQWTHQISEADFQNLMQKIKGRQEKNSIALYTHIPFCEQKCYYCACNVVITKHRNKAAEYLEILKKDIARIAPQVPSANVTQIHWGGGTPTYLTCEQMEALFKEYQKYFTISEDAEISIEVDPRVTTREQLKLLKQLGFNRISLGVQDFDARVQSAINRHQTEAETKRLHDWCKELEFKSINMDFVYGLPYQNRESFEKNLKTIVDLHPDRIAFYNYAHVPWMVPWQKLIPMASLPKAELKLQFLEAALNMFDEAGYLAIGMDHFAKPTDELIQARNEGTLRRNFMGYTTQKDSLLVSFGVSAISDYYYGYIQNFRRLSDYLKSIQNDQSSFMRGYLLSDDDLLRRHIIMELLCNLVLDISKVERDFKVDFFDTFKTELALLEEMVSEGLLTVSKQTMRVTELGRLLIRNICMVFDSYYQQQKASTPKRYSRTI